MNGKSHFSAPGGGKVTNDVVIPKNCYELTSYDFVKNQNTRLDKARVNPSSLKTPKNSDQILKDKLKMQVYLLNFEAFKVNERYFFLVGVGGLLLAFVKASQICEIFIFTKLNSGQLGLEPQPQS